MISILIFNLVFWHFVECWDRPILGWAVEWIVLILVFHVVTPISVQSLLYSSVYSQVMNSQKHFCSTIHNLLIQRIEGTRRLGLIAAYTSSLYSLQTFDQESSRPHVKTNTTKKKQHFLLIFIKAKFKAYDRIILSTEIKSLF